MRTSYKIDDVTLLLKDITGMVEPLSIAEREKRIHEGTHYCEMLPREDLPEQWYINLYEELLDKFAPNVANLVALLAHKLLLIKGNNIVLVSLARAGIPIGILLKRYLKDVYHLDIPHYAISVIRGKGIDMNALNYLHEWHRYSELVFVDGWTGKGAIRQALNAPLAVLADPAGVAEFYATREDVLIPSCCLNSIVSGLISRTFYREDIIAGTDYHGAMYYEWLEPYDRSYEFIDKIEICFSKQPEMITSGNLLRELGINVAKRICEEYKVGDINLVKPGIGETTRVLLRRNPERILISQDHVDDQDIQHIVQLAISKDVPIEFIPLTNYKTIGIINNEG